MKTIEDSNIISAKWYLRKLLRTQNGGKPSSSTNGSGKPGCVQDNDIGPLSFILENSQLQIDQRLLYKTWNC